MSKIRKGRIIRGTVTGIESYGVFVSCDDYYTGLIHISEISHGFVKNITDFVHIGDLIFVASNLKIFYFLFFAFVFSHYYCDFCLPFALFCNAFILF